MRANPDFPQPWPAQVSTFAQLETVCNAYRDALHVAANRPGSDQDHQTCP